MREGVYAAVDAGAGADRRRPGQHRRLLHRRHPAVAATLAHMAAKGDKRIASATFFAAQQDFAEAGDLLLFTNEDWLSELEQQMDAAGGVLPGQAMADTFNALRANDLIWSFFVNNYLMGKEPTAFDLLFWNSDQTRMPKTLHLFYLRDFYGQNALAKGELELGGVTARPGEGEDADLRPVLARRTTSRPTRSVYRGAQAVRRAGHLHPGRLGPHRRRDQPPGRQASTSTGPTPTCPPRSRNGMAGAEEHPGSWWPHWAAWLEERVRRAGPRPRSGQGAAEPSWRTRRAAT